MSFQQIFASIAIIAATVNLISSEPQRVQRDELLPERGPDSSAGAETRDDWHELRKLSSHQRSRRHAAAYGSRQKRQAGNNGPCQYLWSRVGNSYGWVYICNNAQAKTPTTYNYSYSRGQQPGSWNYNYNYGPQQQTLSTYGYNYQQQQQSRPLTYNCSYQQQSTPFTYGYNYQQHQSRPLIYNYSYQQQSRPSSSDSNSNDGKHRGKGRRPHHRSGRRHHRRTGRQHQ